MDGEQRIKLFGQDIVVKAKVHTIGGFSAHAGQSELLQWAKAIGGEPKFWLVHGETKAQQALQQEMAALGLEVEIAAQGQQIHL